MRYTMSGIIPQKLTLNFLIDELQEGEKLIDITLPVYSKFSDDEELREIMYNAVVANYCWSELGFETADQFKMWFQTYWNRVLFKYLNDLRNQIMIGENLITARIETAHTDDQTTETPELTDTTTDTYGETNEITHGHVLQHNRELTEDFTQGVILTEETERTQYETQTITDSGSPSFFAHSGVSVPAEVSVVQVSVPRESRIAESFGSRRSKNSWGG